MASVRFTIPEPLPPTVTVSVVLNAFPMTPEVPIWCFHNDENVMAMAITEPDSVYGLMFKMPGENPEGHFMPSFIWPGVSGVPWIQHIPSSASARVTLVSTDEECDVAFYGDAVPVVKDERWRPLTDYLHVTEAAPMICFFELATSTPLLLDNVAFSHPVGPAWGAQIEGVKAANAHRGLPVTVLLKDVNPGELGQVFLLSGTQFDANGGHCVAPYSEFSGLYPSQWPLGDISKKAAAPIRPVLPLPAETEGFSHYAFFDELETANLVLNAPYFLCYLGNSSDVPQIFNPIQPAMMVTDVIIQISEDPALPPPNSIEINVQVANTLTGSVMCMVMAYPLSRPPNSDEIGGTYFDNPTVINELGVLARSGPVDAVQPNANVTVSMDVNQEAVPQIQKTPLGVRPEVHVWCTHSRSVGVVFPNTGAGWILELHVTPPPNFYLRRGGVGSDEVGNITFAEALSFVPLEIAYEVEGYPRYDYDDVETVVSPPMPADLVLTTDPQTKKSILTANPLPIQVSPRTAYTVTASSTRELVDATLYEINIQVVDAVLCRHQLVKSSDVVFECDFHDADNIHSTGVYFGIKNYDPNGVERSPNNQYGLPLMDPCRGRISEEMWSGSRGPTAASDFQCFGTNDMCCCFARTPWAGQAESPQPSYGIKRMGVRLQYDNCAGGIGGDDIVEFNRYTIVTMAVGIDVNDGNARKEVVSREMTPDFQRPEQKVAEPVQFELTLENFDFERCDETRVPEAQVKECKAALVAELEELLGLTGVDCGGPCIEIGDITETST
jgi:hypothetical protein